jgi:hypothetical protein
VAAVLALVCEALLYSAGFAALARPWVSVPLVLMTTISIVASLLLGWATRSSVSGVIGFLMGLAALALAAPVAYSLLSARFPI